jgi:hypothetical protein
MAVVDPTNRYDVRALPNGRVAVLCPIGSSMLPDDALNLAAWLVRTAKWMDPRNTFEEVQQEVNKVELAREGAAR